MDGYVDIYLHHTGKWEMEPNLSYVGGELHIIERFDTTFLLILSV